MSNNTSFDYEKTFMGVGELMKKTHHIMERFDEHISYKEGKFLEFGCGGGRFIESVKHYFPRFEAYGCDISKTAIEFAQKTGNKAIHYQSIENGEMPYPRNFFDVCAAIGVLEHIEDIGAEFKKLHRILKEKGELHIYMPCEGNKFTFTRFFRQLGFLNDLTYKSWGHIQPELTNRKLFKLLEENGFRILKVSYSQQIVSQILNLFVYFFPKEILNFVLGKEKAFQYSDSGTVLNAEEKNAPRIYTQARGKKKDLISSFRGVWMKIMNLNAKLIDTEARMLKNVPSTALYVHITAEKTIRG